MRYRQRIEPILETVLKWAKAQSTIRAVALVGSHARGIARPDSDIDLMLLTAHSDAFHADNTWVHQIDWHRIDTHPEKWRDDNYGVAWSRHICLAADPIQAELAFAPLFWAKADRPDAGTRRVLSDGCRILYDPDALLARLCEAVGRIERADSRDPC